MQDCTNCGARIKPGAMTCPTCGIATAYQKTQRVCLNCGAAVASEADECLMCGHSIDALPARATTFSISWPGFAVGLLVIVALTAGAVLTGMLSPRPPTSIAIAANQTPTNSPTPTETPIPPTATPTGTITPTSTPPPTLTPTPKPPTATPTPLIHAVRRGETLTFLARKYNVDIDDIVRVNRIRKETLLKIDQPLVIPLTYTGAQFDQAYPAITYTIKAGDTVSGIASEYDVSMADIAQANQDINIDLLSIGQEILIPFGGPIETPTPIPTATFTPAPPYLTPNLLLPADGAVIEANTSIRFNWTATAILPNDVFYVIFLTDASGNTQTYATQASSYRLPDEAISGGSPFTWYVVVMKKEGTDGGGLFQGQPLSNPSNTRQFQIRE